MRFKIDENLPPEAVDVLRTRGHDVLTVRDQNLTGAADQVITGACTAENRVFVTMDLDFSDIRAYPPGEHQGLVVFRLARQSRRNVLSCLTHLLPLLETEQLTGRLWIVGETEIRIRGGNEP